MRTQYFDLKFLSKGNFHAIYFVGMFTQGALNIVPLNNWFKRWIMCVQNDLVHPRSLWKVNYIYVSDNNRRWIYNFSTSVKNLIYIKHVGDFFLFFLQMIHRLGLINSNSSIGRVFQFNWGHHPPDHKHAFRNHSTIRIPNYLEGQNETIKEIKV